MELSVEGLKAAGGFIGGPVKRTVRFTTKDGEEVEFDTWVRPMSYHTAVKDIQAHHKGGDLISHRIAGCICHEDGSPVFTVSDITGLDENGMPIMIKQGNKQVERGALSKDLADALMILVSEVSSLGKTKAK